MPSYNFKRNTKIYVVKNSARYELGVYPDISFSQTFDEEAVPVKTLHAQTNMFEDAVINSANPANFSMTLPLLTEPDITFVLGMLLNYDTTSSEVTVSTADIYVVSDTEVYKLEKSVFEGVVFQFEKGAPVLLSVTGTASKMSRFGNAGVALPGVLQAKNPVEKFVTTNAVEIKLNSGILKSVTSLSVEFRNEVQWTDHKTLHRSLAVTGPSDTMYPEAFVVSKRILSGNVSLYVTDETNSTVNTWSNNSSLGIAVGDEGTGWALVFDMPSVVYTNRLDMQEIYVQTFDFRMNHNPSSMSDIIRFYTNWPFSTSGLWAAL